MLALAPRVGRRSAALLGRRRLKAVPARSRPQGQPVSARPVRRVSLYPPAQRRYELRGGGGRSASRRWAEVGSTWAHRVGRTSVSVRPRAGRRPVRHARTVMRPPRPVLPSQGGRARGEVTEWGLLSSVSSLPPRPSSSLFLLSLFVGLGGRRRRRGSSMDVRRRASAARLSTQRRSRASTSSASRVAAVVVGPLEGRRRASEGTTHCHGR